MVDVKAAISRFTLGDQSDSTEIEYLAWFRFQVTWNYLSAGVAEVRPDSSPRPAPASSALTIVPAISAPPARDVAVDSGRTENGVRPPTGAPRWEMVVPKMVRTPSQLPATFVAAAAPALKSEPPVEAPAAPSPVSTSALPFPESAPTLHTPSFLLLKHDKQFQTRYWPYMAFAAIMIAAIGRSLWMPGPASPAPNLNWSHQSISTPGKSITLYEPSRGQSDYRMDFSWVPDSAGVGWVFRTRDGNNYYAERLSLQPHASDSLLVAEHFSVFGGREGAHFQRVIPLPKHSGLVRVHMDAIGSEFKLFLENNPADSWYDSRLKSGALGFYADGDHLPKLLALSFTFINNQVTRTAVASLP